MDIATTNLVVGTAIAFPTGLLLGYVLTKQRHVGLVKAWQKVIAAARKDRDNAKALYAEAKAERDAMHVKAYTAERKAQRMFDENDSLAMTLIRTEAMLRKASGCRCCSKPLQYDNICWSCGLQEVTCDADSAVA